MYCKLVHSLLWTMWCIEFVFPPPALIRSVAICWSENCVIVNSWVSIKLVDFLVLTFKKHWNPLSARIILYLYLQVTDTLRLRRRCGYLNWPKFWTRSSVHLVINFLYLLNFVDSKKVRASWAPPNPEPRSRIALRSFHPQAISSRLLLRLFSSHLARYKYNIPRPISHKPKQARFKYISRSKIGGKVTGAKWP